MSGHGVSGKARLLLAVSQATFDAVGVRLGPPRLYDCVPVDDLLAKLDAMEADARMVSGDEWADGHGVAVGDLRAWLGV